MHPASHGLPPYQIGKLCWNELEKFSISTPIMWKIKFCFIIRNLNICRISFSEDEDHIDNIIFIEQQLQWQQMQLSIIIGWKDEENNKAK